MKKIFFSAFMIGLVLLSSRPSAAEGITPKQSVEKTIDGIVKAVAESPGDEKTKERRSKLRDIINPRFDFDKMAQLSLGAAWKDINGDQQKEFTSTFSNLLAKTYLVKIETVKAGMVSIETESVDETGQKATVKTLVKSKGDVFPIDYKLLNENGEWKVYDVVIENIGLIVNYRNEFSSIIRKDQFAGLMLKLKEKLEGDA